MAWRVYSCLLAVWVVSRFDLLAQNPPERPVEFIVKFKMKFAATAQFRQVAGPPASWLENHSIETARPLHSKKARIPKRAPRGRLPNVQTTYVLRPKPQHAGRHRELIEQLQNDPEIEWAQINQLVQAHFLPNDPFLASSNSWSQGYGDLYGLTLTRAPQAWDVARGSGVVVAVIDTGVDYLHPDLQPNIFINAGESPSNNIDDDGNGFVDDFRGWDFVGPNYVQPREDNDPADPGRGHGTHVAGTIAAVGNNGAGVIGMAWGARILIVKALDDAGFGDDAVLARAIVYAADNGADVINASWGGGGDSPVQAEAIEYAHGLGVVFVASAGNNAANLNGVHPANIPDVIAVAASDHRDQRASFSNFGERLDLTAPGVDILSLRAAGTSGGIPVNEFYIRANGTSMAAPHVSGVAALLLAHYPSWTPEQIRQALRKSAFDAASTGFDTNSGYGRLDAAAALARAEALEARIRTPRSGELISTPVFITGFAAGPGFQEYILEYGPQTNPSLWTTVVRTNRPVSQDLLGVFDPDLLADGEYAIRLRVLSVQGQTYEDHTHLVVDKVNISDPAAPSGINVAQVFKPGISLQIKGNALGRGFQHFTVQWARGLAPSNGWTANGLTLSQTGAVPVTNGLLATWSTAVQPPLPADFHTLRLTVRTASATSEATTFVYFEPDLISTDWPQWLDQGPLLNVGMLPLKLSDGRIRLTMTSYSWYRSPETARLWSFSPDGRERSWRDLQASSRKQHAVGNLDSAPGDEIAVVGTEGILLLDEQLGVKRVLGAFDNFTRSTIVISDVDNDSSPEVIAASGYGSWHSVYIWKTNGQMFIPAPGYYNANLENEEWGQNSVLPVDLDLDGKKELVIAASDGNQSLYLRALNRDGTTRWVTPTVNSRLNQFSAADLDHDGSPEIVLSSLDSSSPYSNRIFVFDRFGNLRPNWPALLPSLANSERAYFGIADLDRNGTDEIVISADHLIHALRVDATALNAAWPKTDTSYENGPLAIADLNNDTLPDIVVVQTHLTARYEDNDVRLSAYRHDGSLFKSWRLFGIRNVPANHFQFVIGDFDGNGKTDIALCAPLLTGTGGIRKLDQGVVTVLTLNETYNPLYSDWPMNFRDPQNSSVRLPPPLSIAKSDRNLKLSWPTEAGHFHLESAPRLILSPWTRINPAITVTNNTAHVLVSPTSDHQFYRLR